MRRLWFLGVIGLWIAACGGGEDPVEVGGEETTAEQLEAWTAPQCAVDATGLDSTVEYSRGSLRLCVGEAEVRLWALDASGKPDVGFHKSDADVVFLPVGGDEQMINGILLKGSAEEGFATRLMGHGGTGLASVHVTVGDEQVRFK